MQLNKCGWGLKEMLLLSGILVLFLIIAIYYIYTLYDGIGMSITDSEYIKMEEKLESQARVFLSDYYDSELTNENITISRAVLKNYNLDVSLIDSNGNACSGYVIANVNEVNSYIKCSDYKTYGYEE